MPLPSSPTARDVARLAGVSVATVSYVLNGHDDRVGEATRARVHAAARELHYAPNQSARSLRRRRTERVCLVIGEIGVPAYDRLASDLHETADRAGYAVITLVVDDETQAARAIELLHQRLADGALIAGGLDDLSSAIPALAASGFPLVVSSNRLAPEGFDVVRTPIAEYSRIAVEHLIRIGRERIGFLRFRHGPPNPRLEAYDRALAEHGIAERIVETGADTRVEAYQATQRLLARDPRPDAIFASSDRAALSALWAIRDAGLRVPDDIAVVGIGNLDEGRVVRPNLTSVGPAEHSGTDLARMLFERIGADRPIPGREITTPWSFYRRESA